MFYFPLYCSYDKLSKFVYYVRSANKFLIELKQKGISIWYGVIHFCILEPRKEDDKPCRGLYVPANMTFGNPTVLAKLDSHSYHRAQSTWLRNRVGMLIIRLHSSNEAIYKSDKVFTLIQSSVTQCPQCSAGSLYSHPTCIYIKRVGLG